MLSAVRRRLHVRVPGVVLVVVAVAVALATDVLSHTDPAGACTDQNHSKVINVAGSSDGFSQAQLHALDCMGMPAVVPTKPLAGFGDAHPDVAVSAHGMMYNVTWSGPSGRTASLMIDHSLGSKLDIATSNRRIDLGGGVTGYLTDYGPGGNDYTALELAWKDPRTHMWYKINGLSPSAAIAMYHTLTPADLAHAR